MRRRIYGLETEYALGVETVDRRLRPIDPGMLFDHLETGVRRRYRTLEGDSFGRNPETIVCLDGDGIGIREGRFLESGARFYYDTGHVEWATPETTSAADAVYYGLAGEATLVEVARELKMPQGTRLILLKNNVDYAHGRTYGCHENYLVHRGESAAGERRFLALLIEQLAPFLVTRQIFTGAGKVGATDPSAGVGYQISQRADYIERLTSEETRSERAIVNLRDESLSDPRRFRRLHLILGDSNRSPIANLLKLGTTGLVLQMIEHGGVRGVPRLADPVAAMRSVSRDLTCRRPLPLERGGAASPIEVQRAYLAAAEGQLPAETISDPSTREILTLWREVLDDLDIDPRRAADRVDWVIKLHHLLDPLIATAETTWQEAATWCRLLTEFDKERGGAPAGGRAPSPEQIARWQFLIEQHGLDWNGFETQRRLYYRLRERDLRYHDLDPQRSLFSLLETGGRLRMWVDPKRIQAARVDPPGDTRASLRARVIRWAHATGHERTTLLDWGRVALPEPRGVLALDDPFRASAPELDRYLAGRPLLDGDGAGGEIPIRILSTEDLPPRRERRLERRGGLLRRWFGG